MSTTKPEESRGASTSDVQSAFSLSLSLALALYISLRIFEEELLSEFELTLGMDRCNAV